MPNITEIKRVIIIHESRKGSVLLRWVNNLGDWDGWLFQGKTVTNFNVDNEISYLDTKARHYNTISKDSNESMILRTYVIDDNQKQGLQGLLVSPLVHAVINDVEQPCQVVTGSFTLLDEMQKKNILQVEITLDRINALTQ